MQRLFRIEARRLDVNLSIASQICVVDPCNIVGKNFIPTRHINPETLQQKCQLIRCTLVYRYPLLRRSGYSSSLDVYNNHDCKFSTSYLVIFVEASLLEYLVLSLAFTWFLVVTTE